MTGFVLDASVTMRWILGGPHDDGHGYAQAVLLSMKASDVAADVPVTWALEVGNVLARAEARDVLTEAHSEAFLEMLASIPVRADAATFARALGDTLHLARRYRLSSYHASYLELALRNGLPLATLDGDLWQAAHKAGVRRFEP